MRMSRRRFVETSAMAMASAGVAQAATPWTLPPVRAVRTIENSWIPMADGERLAVTLWTPQDAENKPVPVVLETIPYRKRDRYRSYGAYWGRTLASHGIAYARVDTRGSGDSSGILADEYLPQEQEDAAQAIAWLAGQPWCNGAVGMRGVSWGGFITLQTAALAPPALRAIMPFCATDRRFTDDAHYIGGAPGLTGLKWAASFKLVMAGPPDPQISGPDWRAQWLRRLQATPDIATHWLRRQREDAYWRQGSVGMNLAAIRCPTYVVGGVLDAYNNAILRMLQGLSVPRKALIGPWRHGYPAPASPGPGLDWAREEVRWWDHWLNGVATGIMDEPMMRVYMPSQTAGQSPGAALPGRWIAETAWPPQSVQARRLHLNAGGKLERQAGAPAVIRLPAGGLVGLASPEWVPFAPSETPAEQSADDRGSLVFDTTPLDLPLEILGRPRATIRVTADKPFGHLALRLCEVSPAGESWLVSWGLLNLTHRNGHSAPEPVPPGKPVDIIIDLNFTAHKFAKGSLLRLAVSDGLWPLTWPSPGPVTLDIVQGRAQLSLPVRSPPSLEAPFAVPLTQGQIGAPTDGPAIAIDHDADGAVTWRSTWPASETKIAETGVTTRSTGPDAQLCIIPGRPNSGRWRVTQSSHYRATGWDCAVESLVELSSTETMFHIHESLVARQDGAVIFTREHENDIPRDLM